jgi:hypothetical protein
MKRYTVRVKSTIYYDADITTLDEESAKESGIHILHKMLENTMLPTPLEFDLIEVWDIEEIA